MKLFVVATAIVSTLNVATAAPAIVWKNGSSSSGPLHTSDPINARSVMASSISGDDSSSALAAAIFVVGRDADGTEGLRKLAAAGSLPSVHQRYASADSIHHQVNGVESARTMARDARNGYDGKVVEVSLEEFNRKLSSIGQDAVESTKKVSKVEQKRRRDIAQADVLVVSVKPNDSSIDSSISAAIDSSAIRTVVLSSVRSIDEVKHARKLAVAEKFVKVNSPRRQSRRLEDEANNENADNAQVVDGVYYVNMTPNIFAGLLFFFMFAFTAHLGLMCMNMIEGQDVYVKKMPHIGREV